MIMLCGLPGSGKSTIAGALAERLGSTEVLAIDDIGARKDRREALKQRLDRAASRSSYIILDGAFFRRELRDGVRGLGYAVLLVYLKCPLRVCLQRNESRQETIDSGGVIVMHHRFQPPAADESPVVLPTERIAPEVAARLIHRAIDLVRDSGPAGRLGPRGGGLSGDPA
ncbi:MAG: AAA family ATPase [Gemmatimonadetes bacterium]|nr:AAA family ATPase [Gemmatimonadota bacterium]